MNATITKRKPLKPCPVTNTRLCTSQNYEHEITDSTALLDCYKRPDFRNFLRSP